MKEYSKTPKKIAIIIPCYNEAASIAQVIAKFPMDSLSDEALQVKIYVVDNNSSDGTAAIAKKMGAHVIHEPKKGKGNALRAGFRSIPSNVDYVAMLDGDDTYSPEEIMRLLEPLRNNFCDVVVGSRLEGHIQAEAMSRLNRFGNRLFTVSARTLYRANVSDVLTGYFAWKKSALNALAPHIKSDGFAIEMEMITKMARLGQRMASVPISYHPRLGQSNMHPFRDGFRIFLMLFKNLTWHPKPQANQAQDTINTFSPRKIVFVSDAIYPYMKGGKEKRLYEITTRLAAMGHDVHIYTMHWWKSPEKTQKESGVYLHAICKYHNMYSGNRRAIKEGVLFGLSCLKLAWQKFDVIDVDHMPFFPIFSAWIVCLLRGRKLHATWHEALTRQEWTAYMGPRGIIAAFIERLSIKLPHRITAASEHTRQLLATVHGRVERVDLVPSGIDTSLLDTVQPASIHCDVLYVGRLVKDKNVDKLIAAVEIIAQTRPDVQCMIVGQGTEKQRLQKMVIKLRMQNNVTFAKPLAKAAEVYAYMKAARVFCLPSVREGFGIVALEALGCGTPVITIESPTNAARSLIQDGVNGSVVPLNPAALADSIRYWASMDQKPNIAFNAANYDWHNLAQKQAEVYSL
jgi:glycosyltransferase involved in cell wall biosynthesis